MINSQRLIRVTCVIAIGVIIYALRPMPEYALHAQMAAGMYDKATNTTDRQTLDSLNRLASGIEAELISAQALLDIGKLPTDAIKQLNNHLGEIASQAKDMHGQLVTRFGKQRVQEMINLPPWATETLALTQVLAQTHLPANSKTLSDEQYRTLRGNLQWVERTLGDLQEMIRRQLPINTLKREQAAID